MITDRGKAILSALKSPEIAREGHDLLSVYCIRHIASNFNKKFKKAEAKRQLINMDIYLNLIHLYWLFLLQHNHFKSFNFLHFTGYEMKQPTLQAKLSALRSQFQQAFAWIDQIPLKKWTQAYDEGRRYGHMTTNLA